MTPDILRQMEEAARAIERANAERTARLTAIVEEIERISQHMPVLERHTEADLVRMPSGQFQELSDDLKRMENRLVFLLLECKTIHDSVRADRIIFDTMWLPRLK